MKYSLLTYINLQPNPVIYRGGGGGGGSSGGSDGNAAGDTDPITKKMNQDNSATTTAHEMANGGDPWTQAEQNAHAAGQANSGANGWPSSGRITGCHASCHEGGYDY